jgi:hypothetical protein
LLADDDHLGVEAGCLGDGPQAVGRVEFAHLGDLG